MRAHVQDRARQVVNLVLIPAGIAFNMIPGIREREIAAVARASEPLLAASGWAFSIWGLIFAWTLVYAVYQALPSQTTRRVHRAIGWHTASNGLLGGLWTYLFTQELFTAAWITMVALLLNLIAIEIRLGNEARSGRDRMLVRVPFAINLGWISVATILDTTQWLWSTVGWDGAPLTPIAWSIIMVAAAAALAAAMLHLRRNLPFALVTVWALAAIATYVKEESVSVVAVLCAGALLFMIAVKALVPRRASGEREARARSGRLAPARS